MKGAQQSEQLAAGCRQLENKVHKTDDSYEIPLWERLSSRDLTI